MNLPSDASDEGQLELWGQLPSLSRLLWAWFCSEDVALPDLRCLSVSTTFRS